MPTVQIDIVKNRAMRNYSRVEMARRVLWSLMTPLFRLSPRVAFRWRCLILRSMGSKVGAHVRVYSSTRITMPWNLEIGEYSTFGEEAIIYNLTRIRIGSRATISQRAHICGGTHDHTRPEFPLIKTPISIGDDVWVAADAFIGPGVTVGDGAVVGARAVVTADVSPWIVVAGNPATMIKTRSLIPEITE